LREGGQLKGEKVGDAHFNDPATYRVWHNPDGKTGPAGRYLIDMQGRPAYLVDPGINGVVKERADGTDVTKYNAPKATLMSYIIKGILSRELPWGLVLLGVMIAIVLELSGIRRSPLPLDFTCRLRSPRRFLLAASFVGQSIRI
jgi:hypothetical protein